MIHELEEYAHINKIPIMLPDGIDYLCKFIKDNNIKDILEIGSAIGYSAIRMAMVSDNIKITTVEKDDERYLLAVKNIDNFNLNDRIQIIHDDALNTIVNYKYDLIFIDASKGNNINFFNKYKENLNENGVIVTDNLAFHGLVDNPELAVTRNQRGLVKRIKEFISFLDNNSEFKTEYIDVGDRISISRKMDIWKKKD